MKSRLRIVIVGGEGAGLHALRLVHRSGHDVVGVFASEDTDANRGATLWSAARSLGYPVRPSQLVREAATAEELRELEVDLLVNVHSLHIAVPEVVAAPRIGSFNLHPGPLPDYAGLNGPSWAVYHGEASYGVTLHWMRAGIDTGEIAYQESFDIASTDTGLTVSSRCVRRGIPLIQRLLDDAQSTDVPRRPQNLGERRFFRRGDRPNEGRIDWRRSARQVEAHVRAADFRPLPSPWGSPLATCSHGEIGVVEARLTGQHAGTAPGTVSIASRGEMPWVATGDEWIEVRRIQHADGVVRDSGSMLLEGDRLR